MYLLPLPQKIQYQEGHCYLPYNGKIIIDQTCAEDVFHIADILKQELMEQTGMDYLISRGTSKNAVIALNIQENFNKEMYSLSIQEKQITIIGGGSQGLLHGIQTLRQIIRQEGACLPVLTIEDYPAMENRGLYHDVTRGRIPTLSYLKSLADTLSFYKLNQLQLYIEHSFMFEGLSEMWRDDTPITAEEIMELDRYCNKLGIELVPSVSSFGHLYKLLRTKTYVHLSELPDESKEPFSFVGRMEHHTLNVTLEESYELVVKLIEEYLPLFTSNQFNLGADETFDLGKGASKKMADEIGLNRLYINFVKKLCNFLVEKGKRPMFWGDVICGFPELITELPKETICLNWGYAWNQIEDGTKALAGAGAVQYVCPGVCGWNQFVNLTESSYLNIKRMCNFGDKYNAIGMLNTDWGDFGHINHPTFGTPGLIYGAAFSWNRQDISFEEINRQISVLEYRDHSEKFLEICSDFCKYSTFQWEMAVRFQEMERKGKTKEEQRDYILSKSDQLLEAEKTNKLLKQKVQNLQKCIKSMDSKTRPIIQTYQIAADGIEIFNCIGAAIVEIYEQKENREFTDLNALAQRLEYWFYYYKKLWRSVSKESELYQISECIFWYADFLRENR